KWNRNYTIQPKVHDGGSGAVTMDEVQGADKGEADEQQTFLQELDPKWMHEKTASSSDLLL
ncbi:hypothetical protein Tco_0036843, partial [Tanacetum coccineum]